MSDFATTTEDDVSPIGGRPSIGRDAPGPRVARGSIVESMTIGGSDAKTENAGRGDVEDVTIGPRGGHALSEGALKLLASFDSPPAAAEPAAAPEVITPAAVTPPAAAAVAPVAPAETPAPDEHVTRLTEHNRKLLGELETLRARPARGEPSAREKALDEAEKGYHEDPMLALRRFVATTLGVSDPASKEVDAELSGLYQDLTERELGVPLDTAEKAKRESIRTRRLLDRDRRERQTPATAAPADDSAAREAEMTTLVAGKLGADHATKYPLLSTLSAEFSGMKPEQLLWRGINRGFATGELDPKTPDAQLIEHVSKQIETHYQALADKIVKARPSTATPAQPQDATASKADPQGNGVRTITNASASVAPATPPASKPAPTQEQQPKYRSEKERRLAIARRILDGQT